MKYIICLLLTGCSLAQADSDLTGVRNLVFGTADSFHYITVQDSNDFIIQTGDGAGSGGGINLISGSSVQISASGYGTMAISADMDNGSVTVSSHDGAVVLGDSLSVYTSAGLQLYQSGSPPSCSSGRAGTLNYQPGGSGVADTLQVCAKDASDAYSWKSISF